MSFFFFSDRDGKSVFDFVKPALIGEADRAAEIHKNIYDKLMSSKGPYQNILKSVSNILLSLSLSEEIYFTA